MEKGNYTKYPHIFKANDILEKQKRERINMQNEYDEMTSSKRKGSLMGRSMNSFNVDSQMRNTLRMNTKNSNMYNSIDVSHTQYMGDRGQAGGFFNNSNLSIQKQSIAKDSTARISEEEMVVFKDKQNPSLTQQVWDKKLPNITASGEAEVFSDQTVTIEKQKSNIAEAGEQSITETKTTMQAAATATDFLRD